MPATLDANTQDPLYYHAGWTDDGVVVIEHKTDIGEGVDASAIAYYSIYLHLRSMPDAFPASGKPVWRKDEIGQAGFIYGKPDRIHFEIICDDANLKKIVNRSTGPLDTSTDGRTDSVWGEIYVKLPSGAEVTAADPQAAVTAPKKADGEQFLGRDQLLKRLADESIERKALSRTVCKFPSEWDKATIASRWGWLKDQAKAIEAGLTPMTDADFNQLTEHLEALCFWSEAGLTALPTPWHFEPREFVGEFRQCGWFSAGELSRVLSSAPAQGRSRAEILRKELNKVTRKYLNISRLSAGHFFAQIGHETGWWQFREDLVTDDIFVPCT